MAGLSKGQEFIASGASQSVFIAKQDGKQFLWMNTIDHKEVDNPEEFFTMGDSSQFLVLLASSSLNTRIPYLYRIRKSDGGIASVSKLNIPAFGNIISNF